jgi:hypothetical protein
LLGFQVLDKKIKTSLGYGIKIKENFNNMSLLSGSNAAIDHLHTIKIDGGHKIINITLLWGS